MKQYRPPPGDSGLPYTQPLDPASFVPNPEPAGQMEIVPNVFLEALRKPCWFHRWMVRWLLGWKWHDKNGDD